VDTKGRGSLNFEQFYQYVAASAFLLAVRCVRLENDTHTIHTIMNPHEPHDSVFVGLKIFHSFDKRDRSSIHREELRNALRSVSLHPEEVPPRATRGTHTHTWHNVDVTMMQERLDDMLAMTEPVHPTKVTFPEFLEIFVEAQREDDPHKVPPSPRFTGSSFSRL